MTMTERLWPKLDTWIVDDGIPMRTLRMNETLKLPGAFAFEYRSDEAGDVCWDCLLGLVREGVRIYRAPDLETDVGRTFPRHELGGLKLRVHLVDGVRVGYLCDMPPAPPSPIVEIIRCAEETPAETIKQRLIAFLHWPANSRGLDRDWGEVVDELLAGGDASTLETAPSSLPSPIPMLLACPVCHTRHVDEGEWSTRPHRTHLCSRCGATWQPALVHTVGVTALSVHADAKSTQRRTVKELPCSACGTHHWGSPCTKP